MGSHPSEGVADVAEFDVHLSELPPEIAMPEIEARLRALLNGRQNEENVGIFWEFMRAVEQGKAARAFPDENDEYPRQVSIRDHLRMMMQWPSDDLSGYCDEVRQMVLRDGLGATMINARYQTQEDLEQDSAVEFAANPHLN